MAKLSASLANGEKVRPRDKDEKSAEKPPQKRQRSAPGSSLKLEPRFAFEKATSNTLSAGKHAFEWLIHPVIQKKFFADLFEKKPHLVRRPSAESKRFAPLVSASGVKSLILSGALRYGLDVDVTTYTPDDGRATLNGPHGSPVGPEAWQAFEQSGASIRLLRPQVHFEGIFRLCGHVEEFLHCVVGANVYLTPADSQGFAPHFDDVDAFVCQVAGEKRWHVYEPREDKLDLLPRRSSVDFSHAEMASIETVVDDDLRPGDMLYLPRGAVHEARAPAGDEPALHVTVSVMQNCTWADLLESVAVQAVRSAAAEDVALRRALPVRFHNYAGSAASELDNDGNNDDDEAGNAQLRQRREDFHSHMGKLWKRVARALPSDAAADSLIRRFQHDRLPPVRTGRCGSAQISVRVGRESSVRAVGAGYSRVVLDVDGETAGLPRLVSCAQNGRGRDEDSVGMSCLPEEALAVHEILKAYPKAVKVGDIKLDNMSDRVDLARGLVDLGVVEDIASGNSSDSDEKEEGEDEGKEEQ